MQSVRITIRLAKPPKAGCPYCGTIDPQPRTHLAEGRCKA